MQPDVDRLLGPVAQTCHKAADEILDLREAVLRRSDPGNCLNCYFKIFEIAKTKDTAPLIQLRRWLEQNLEVVARTPKEHELERRPISLHQQDLESFCREWMREFRDNRAYDASAIELSIDYRKSARCPSPSA